MVPSPGSIRFDVYRGEELVRSETFAELIIKIGRVASSHLQLDDELASRLHAMVEVRAPGEIYIVDLGSRVGTYVNGQRSEKSQLHDGDEIRIGETRIVVDLGPGGATVDEVTAPASPSPRTSLPSAASSSLAPEASRSAAPVASTERGLAGRAGLTAGVLAVIALALLLVVLALRS